MINSSKNNWLLSFLLLATLLFVACKKDETATITTTVNPTVTCSDFDAAASGIPPSGASNLPLLIIRIQFEGDLYSDNGYHGDPFAYNHFQSDACTWAKKIYYNQSKGQLNHYFNKVSNNKFHLIPAVETHANNTNQDGIITVTLPGNHPNPQGDGDFVQKLVDALTIADSYIDFSTYDVSDDGILNKSDLQIMFLVAGYETSATGSPDPSVWAHKWCVFGQEGGVNPPTLDGVSILSCLNDGNGYSRFGERQFADGHDATIGIIAHELGHAIWGLPDLYDTDGSSSGIGNFGLMGGGSWGYVEGESPGATPVHPTAWTKIETGWFSPDDTAGAKTMYRTEDNLYNIVKVDITTDTSEYFLIENRGAAGYDLGLFMLTDIPSGTPFQGGIAIWHIDASQDTNSNEARKLVDLEEAANPGLDDDIDRGKSTNLFWDTNNATFDDNSTPDSKDYSATASGVSITNISDRKADMTLIVN